MNSKVDKVPKSIGEAMKPIPSMDHARELRKTYRDLEIDTKHPLYSEKLVSIADFGLAGQAYYSRPNATVAEPIPGVDPNLFLRESVARTFGDINESLRSQKVTDFFGGEVELYVEDALRSMGVQKRLFEVTVPELIRRNHPGLSDEEVNKRRNDIIAEPSLDSTHPAPHATGGAADAILRYVQTDKHFVAGSDVWIGHTDGDTAETIMPDYYENRKGLSESELLARRNRRAFYAIMTGELTGLHTGLIVNPVEIWHWSKGDQLWGKVSGQIPYYGGIKD